MNLVEPHPGRELYPTYVADAGLIFANRRLSTFWPYGVNVGNWVILDLDSERILAGFEVLSRRELWRASTPFPPVPPASRRADLQFTSDTVEAGFFDPPTDIVTDETRSHALVYIGEVRPDVVGVGLSDACMALLNGQELVGFALEVLKVQGWCD